MTFNETLCNKARFGDIAIFNDGDREKLKELLCHIWPKDSASSNPCGEYKYYFKSGRINDGNWYFGDQTDLPAHSVKDFFMTDTKEHDMLVQKAMVTIYILGQKVIRIKRTGWQNLFFALLFCRGLSFRLFGSFAY